MSFRRELAALAAVLVTAGATLVLGAGAASSAASSDAPAAPSAAAGSAGSAEGQVKTVYFDLMYQQHVKPRRIFLTASSGQYMKRLRWEDWGERKAVATGKFISDCASCPDPARREVTLTFRKPVLCEAEGVRTYRKGVGRVSEPSEGSTRTRFQIPMGCP